MKRGYTGMVNFGQRGEWGRPSCERKEVDGLRFGDVGRERDISTDDQKRRRREERIIDQDIEITHHRTKAALPPPSHRFSATPNTPALATASTTPAQVSKPHLPSLNRPPQRSFPSDISFHPSAKSTPPATPTHNLHSAYPVYARPTTPLHEPYSTTN